MKLRNILFPTDFSDQSQQALDYTLALAKDVQAIVYVLHSYYVPINTIETAYVADQAIWLEQARQRAQEEMKMLEERHLQKSGVPYECAVNPGPVMGDINETIKENNIDLVVIGSYEGEGRSNFFGDLYNQAIRHAKAPVLLVPGKARYRFPKNVVFATDLRPIDNQAPLQNLRQILSELGPRLELLHVHKPGEELKQKKKDELNEIAHEFEALKPVAVLVEAPDTEEGILNYAQQHADWLVALSHHYGLLEGLFHSSHTKKLARKTPIPLLVSHE